MTLQVLETLIMWKVSKEGLVMGLALFLTSVVFVDIFQPAAHWRTGMKN